jgi:hypothetical protein
VPQAALHIRPAWPAWEQGCHVEIRQGAQITHARDGFAAFPQAARPVQQQRQPGQGVAGHPFRWANPKAMAAALLEGGQRDNQRGTPAESP